MTIAQYLMSLKEENASALAESYRHEFQDIFDMDVASPCGMDCKAVIDATLARTSAMTDEDDDQEEKWAIWFDAGEQIKVLVRS